MPRITTTGASATEIHYQDVGEGRPVVLVHGWPLSHRMWEHQVGTLVRAGLRCIAYDRRGFGESGRPASGYDYDTFASDLDELITQLDLHDVVLAGFSMGGGEVVRYAARYGTKRIAKAMLLGAVPPFLLKTEDNPDGIDGSVFDGLVEGVRKDRISFLANFFPNFYNADTSGVHPDIIAFSKWIAWGALPYATEQCIVAFGTTDFRRDLGKLDVPTLIVHGDDDRIVPLDISGRRSHEALADSRLEIVKGAPHGFAATHAEQLSRYMVEFARS